MEEELQQPHWHRPYIHCIIVQTYTYQKGEEWNGYLIQKKNMLKIYIYDHTQPYRIFISSNGSAH